MEVRGRQPFRANPVPKISSKPVGVPQLAAAKPVIPESPAFALKHRMESRKRSQQGVYSCERCQLELFQRENFHQSI